MSMALGGGLEVSSVNQQTNLNAGAGQTINAKYLAMTTTGSGSAKLYNQTGVQAITTQGQNGAGEGILLRNAGTGANSVGIINDGTAQNITVNNATAVRLQGVSGEVDIHSAGTQTIVLQGASSANQLQIGLATDAGHSEIAGNSQTALVLEELFPEPEPRWGGGSTYSQPSRRPAWLGGWPNYRRS